MNKLPTRRVVEWKRSLFLQVARVVSCIFEPALFSEFPCTPRRPPPSEHVSLVLVYCLSLAPGCEAYKSTSWMYVFTKHCLVHSTGLVNICRVEGCLWLVLTWKEAQPTQGSWSISIAPFAKQGQAYFRTLKFLQASCSWIHMASFSLSWVIKVSFVPVCLILTLIEERISSESAFQNFEEIIWTELFLCDVWLHLQISTYTQNSRYSVSSVCGSTSSSFKKLV